MQKHTGVSVLTVCPQVHSLGAGAGHQLEVTRWRIRLRLARLAPLTYLGLAYLVHLDGCGPHCPPWASSPVDPAFGLSQDTTWSCMGPAQPEAAGLCIGRLFLQLPVTAAGWARGQCLGFKKGQNGTILCLSPVTQNSKAPSEDVAWLLEAQLAVCTEKSTVRRSPAAMG